jgi:hypothetical protein
VAPDILTIAVVAPGSSAPRGHNVKKLGRFIRRLLIVGALGGGAVLAALKVGPKVRSLLHRTPSEDLDDAAWDSGGAASASQGAGPTKIPPSEAAQTTLDSDQAAQESASE